MTARQLRRKPYGFVWDWELYASFAYKTSTEHNIMICGNEVLLANEAYNSQSKLGTSRSHNGAGRPPDCPEDIEIMRCLPALSYSYTPHVSYLETSFNLKQLVQLINADPLLFNKNVTVSYCSWLRHNRTAMSASEANGTYCTVRV